MSDRAHLPAFVREALEDDEGLKAASRSREGGAPAGTLGSDADTRARAGSIPEPGVSKRNPEPAVDGNSLDRAQVVGIERCFGALLEAAWPESGAPAEGSWRSGAESGTGDFAPSAALFQRLQATIDEPPYRYAPFFARAAELFDLPESTIISELGRLAEPKVWKFAGLPGIQHAAINGGPKVASAETLFVRFAPGVRFPKHRHTGLERVLVLDGSYRDSTGVVHRAGELREWVEGTEHGFVVDPSEPCIFASVVFGRRFSAWPLRALASVLGR
jgi:hypothetical protein